MLALEKLKINIYVHLFPEKIMFFFVQVLNLCILN